MGFLKGSKLEVDNDLSNDRFMYLFVCFSVQKWRLHLYFHDFMKFLACFHWAGYGIGINSLGSFRELDSISLNPMALGLYGTKPNILNKNKNILKYFLKKYIKIIFFIFKNLFLYHYIKIIQKT